MTNNITKIALLFGIIATIGFGTNYAQAAEISGAQGHITLVLQDADGNITQYVQTDNAITQRGLDCMVDTIFIGSAGTGNSNCTNVDPFDVIAIGEGTVSTDSDATGLNNTMPTNCMAVSVTPVQDSGTLTVAIQIEAVFGGDGNATNGENIDNAACIGAITEAGLFSIGDATNLPDSILAYQDFSVINLGATDTLTITWDIDFT